MKIEVSGGQFFADGFAVRGSFVLAEGESRTISCISERGCGCATIRLSEGVPILSEGGIEAICTKEGWDLLPAPMRRVGKPREKRFEAGGRSFFVRCMPGDPSEILISAESEFHHRTVTPLTSPEITLLSGQRDPIVDLRADCEEGRYIALFALGQNGTRLLLENYGDEVDGEGNEVTVRRALPDLLGREITTRYLWRGDRFEHTRTIRYTREPSRRREETGRFLLEAVLARDEEEILRLLSPELASPATLFDYFGEILRLRPAPPSAGPTAYALVKREGEIKVCVTYDFDLDTEGRIANICCLEEE